ncbi:MAG TPA: hypothetical protein VEK08_16955 [Planctomycetota bacterium]|nr:hypothetical protein [Planctomycetota bacterium]
MKQSSTSPDGRFSFDGYVIRDLGTSQILWRIEWSDFSSNPVYKTRYLTGSFVDSNTIELALIDELKESRAIEVIVLQKLSPEDWWKVIALNCSVAAFLAIFTGILCEVIMRCETRKP